MTDTRPAAPGPRLSTPATACLLVGLLLVVGVAAGVGVLWWSGGWDLEGPAAVGARANAVWTGLAAAAGAAVLVGLLLYWRGLRATAAHRALELAQRREREVEERARRQWAAARIAADAVERRIAEAVGQLGADRDPVRMGGLHALERIASATPECRQAVVDVLCACLRAPFEPAEFAVRAAVQRVLTHHLRPGDDPAEPAAEFWADLDLDLTGAHLIDLDLTGCRVRAVTFDQAVFEGRAVFRRTRIGGRARFRGARFLDGVSARGARFGAAADFRDAEFDAPADSADGGFRAAEFHGDTTFARAVFNAPAQFREVRFHSDVSWGRAAFPEGAAFAGADFHGSAWFGNAVLGGAADFTGVRFRRHARFPDAVFETAADFTGARFESFTDFEQVVFRARPLVADTHFANDVPAEVVVFRAS
ncbi:pentapeptide repeat-containing protein [Actinokineospora pegani]|uniref:pentapeptide repeat-containing protein n=1 Tax=Actinokineospora pegani TaxID=2654637 RepID=UPI0012EAEA21|nr:pentapeptide repeat-containing protein [Actinokineospora pegani]